MTRYLLGLFTASILLIAWHVKLKDLFFDLFKNGDTTDFGDVCKQPTYRQMTGRLPNE